MYKYGDINWCASWNVLGSGCFSFPPGYRIVSVPFTVQGSETQSAANVLWEWVNSLHNSHNCPIWSAGEWDVRSRSNLEESSSVFDLYLWILRDIKIGVPVYPLVI